MTENKLLDIYSIVIAKDITDYTPQDQYTLAQEYSKIGQAKAKENFDLSTLKQDRENHKKNKKLILRSEMETTITAKWEEKIKNVYTEDEAKNLVDTDEETIRLNGLVIEKEFNVETLEVAMQVIQMIQPIARETIKVIIANPMQ